MKLADERSKAIVMTNSDFIPGAVFFRTTGMKSHDWKELVAKNILKFCLRGMLQDRQRATLFLFLDAVRNLVAEGIQLDDIDGLQLQLNLALAMIERDFPVDIQVTTMHLLRHVVDGIRCFGPVYGSWMFAYERFNSWLHRRVMNRRFPEATLMETYRIFEWCQFMKTSGKVTVKLDLEHQLLDGNAENQDLPSDVYELLLEMYKAKIPRLQVLCGKYEEEIKKARNRRQKSTFPTFSKWIPTGGLSVGDEELLQGPSKLAVVYKMFVEDTKTNRNIAYSAAERELTTSRYSCSYVRLNSEGNRPRLGQIKMCLSHTFYNQTRKLVVCNVFTTPQLDSQSSLWWVPLESLVTNEQIVIEAITLSPPLVVAKDDGKLWFLTI